MPCLFFRERFAHDFFKDFFLLTISCDVRPTRSCLLEGDNYYPVRMQPCRRGCEESERASQKSVLQAPFVLGEPISLLYYYENSEIIERKVLQRNPTSEPAKEIAKNLSTIIRK